MKSDRLLLSICIPTYNRCSILQNVLESYVNNSEFDDFVEIVISDNASTDGTELMCKSYCEKHKNIRYYRNEENLHDANFIRVLDLGVGEYLKLQNDWVYMTENALKYIKNAISENIIPKPPLFFTDRCLFVDNQADKVCCGDLNDYIAAISVSVTSNNIFGVWKEQWNQIEGKGLYTILKLQQVDWSYQIVTKHNGCILYNKNLFTRSGVPLKTRGGYNWFEVHLDNYYRIMDPYIEKGLICNNTLKKDKRKLLRHFRREFGFVYFYNYSKYWRFETKGTTSFVYKYYKDDIFVLYFLFVELPLSYLWYIVYYLFKKIRR